MKSRYSIFACIFLFSVFLQSEDAWTEMVLNPKGWNLPDIGKMTLARVEKVSLTSVPCEIQVETWIGKSENKYTTKNLLYGSLPALVGGRPVLENPLDLFVFKTPDGRTLCYEYSRQITDKAGFTYGAVTTYIADLDDDGHCEFQMEVGVEPNELLKSIIRIKLGLSEETNLIRRTISSALRSIKK